MKLIGRIFLILAVATLIAGALYLVVNASDSGEATFPEEREFRERRFREFGPEGFRPDLDRQRRPPEGIGLGWLFGLIKNLGTIALIVGLLVGFRRIKPRHPKPAPFSEKSDQGSPPSSSG